MKKLSPLLVLFLIVSTLYSSGQKSPQQKGLESITKEAVQAQLEFLSSDWMEGRGTGERGIYLAGDYVASMFKYAGVVPGGDMQRSQFRRMSGGAIRPSTPSRSYFQNFTLVETLPGGSSDLAVTNGGREYLFNQDVDYRLGRVNSSVKLSGPVVFVGYGIQNSDFGINDLAGVDLKGKIVVRVSGYPGANDPESEMYKKINADRAVLMQFMRGKNSALEGKGILAVIDITTTGDITTSWGVFKDNMNLSPNESTSPSDFSRMRINEDMISDAPVTITVSPKVANAIIGSAINIEKYEMDALSSSFKFKPVVLAGVKANLNVTVNTRLIKARNVVAMIEGKNPNEVIVVGGHLDHMGMSGGRVWNGADDNGSGTVGVMTVAKAFAATGVQPERTIIFCAWTGEEKGLLGSGYFASNPSYGSTKDIKFYLNYDMISRDAPNDTAKVNVGVTYNKDYPYLEELSKRNIESYGLKMNYSFRAQENPTGGSDYTAFSNNKIPIIAVMAAMHPEYHKSNDSVELVNWDKMIDIIKLGFLNLWEIANSDFNN